MILDIHMFFFACKDAIVCPFQQIFICDTRDHKVGIMYATGLEPVTINKKRIFFFVCTKMLGVRRVAQVLRVNSDTYGQLKFAGQNSETHEVVNVGVVALDINKYTFNEGLACNGFMKACSEGIGVWLKHVNMQPKHENFCPWKDTALVNILQKRDLIMHTLKGGWYFTLSPEENQPCSCDFMRRSLIALSCNLEC